ncbi:MAG: DUF4838 domain-containing protein [Armatimonadota bacterium]|jgi:hypothetical protein
MGFGGRAVIVISLAALWSWGAGYAMQITNEGRPVATIVVPDRASETERFAAAELQKYLRQISGATLKVATKAEAAGGARILIGGAADVQRRYGYADLGPEVLTVYTTGDDLELAGTDDRGTLYAVYDFLEEELGCRWLAPGPDWEEVPTRPTIAVSDIDRVEGPVMRYRFLRMTVVGEPASWSDYTMSWAVKNKINIGTGWPPAELSEEITKRGGFRAWMSPHTIRRLLNVEQHFDEHPEWYALRGGKRAKIERAQLCTTNPEVVEVMAARLGEMFDARPEVDFVALGQADGTAFCECEKCTALDTGEIWPSSSGREVPVITERWLGFVNAVGRRLQQTHPGKKIYTLAYHQTFRPPDPEAIKPEPNVIIQVVNSRPNYVCFVHRFEKEGCAHHVKFRKGLEQWVAVTPGGVMVYEYTPHSTFCSMPFPAPRKFAADIKYLHRAGVVGYEGQSSPNNWGTYGFNLYTIAKMTWDPELDADALVKDYCDSAFQEASAPMQRFVAAIEAGLEAAEHVTDGIWTYMTPEVMAEARRHLDAAHASARSERVKKRLRCMEVGFRYGEMGSAAWRQARAALRERDAGGLREAIALAEAAAQYLRDEGEKEAHHVGGAGKLTSVHAAGWRRALARMQQRAEGR